MIPTPEVVIYVRHHKDCTHRDDKFYKSCGCRKWIRWSSDGNQHRIPANTSVWAEAEKQAKRISAKFSPLPNERDTERKTIADAIELFLSRKLSKGIDPDGIKK